MNSKTRQPSAFSRQLVLLSLTVWGTSSITDIVRADDAVSFQRDVRPILASKCFACHGPDEQHRKADLRLDDRAAAVESGAIVPGKPSESDLLARVTSDDDELRMPPKSETPLTEQDKQILKRWIAAGAKYEKHWAFSKPERHVPPTSASTWPRNDIDRFTLAKMRQNRLSPTVQADRYTLVRRLYLDLIGLPPTPAEADAFVNDQKPRAYDRLVDKLLKSERYGEHWARAWLDLARYSDTNGYEKDRNRSIWPYRDWVIKALNADMPFNQFTIEQLAGDMLPNPSSSQLIATGFHRNTMLNEEGGIDPLEYRFYAMVDRVATTGTVWLGMTVGCAQCHSHKYDPISHVDYYRFMALMNNADEPDFAVKDKSLLEQRDKLQMQIDAFEAKLADKFPAAKPTDAKDKRSKEERRRENLERQFAKWRKQQAAKVSRWKHIVPRQMKTNLPKLVVQADDSILSTGDITKRDVFTMKFDLKQQATPIAALRLEVLPDERLPAGGPGRAFYEGRKGDFFLSELQVSVNGRPVKARGASHSFGKISIGSGNAAAGNVLDGKGSTGWATAGREGQSNQLVINFEQPIAVGEKAAGELKIEMIFERHFAASLGRFRFSATNNPEAGASQLPVEIEALLSREQGKLSVTEQAQLRKHYLLVAPELADARKAIQKLRGKLPRFPSTMIFRERPSDNQRMTYRHHRGEYLSPREQVKPGLPQVFGKLPSGPANRLALAKWLVSDQNPLTARVAVNRAWKAFFGAGLVRDAADFGTQADLPSHPKLLDWLATELMAKGWSMKELHRLIVSSATYRQSAFGEIASSPNDRADTERDSDSRKRDPLNRYLSRGPRFRVEAETVRDIMLKASGLLSTKMYGPGVYPPQPKSVTALAYGNTRWPVSQGEDRYRRSLYTFSKRTAPFASFTVFDGPTGENCIAQRNRSNTPLQALTLLNDEMYQEMSRALAAKAINAVSSKAKLDDKTTKSKIANEIFRRLVTRPPNQMELDAIVAFQQQQLARLQKGELAADKILARKRKPKLTTRDHELAAWAMASRSLMNLDESITKP